MTITDAYRVLGITDTQGSCCTLRSYRKRNPSMPACLLVDRWRREVLVPAQAKMYAELVNERQASPYDLERATRVFQDACEILENLVPG